MKTGINYIAVSDPKIYFMLYRNADQSSSHLDQYAYELPLQSLGFKHMDLSSIVMFDWTKRWAPAYEIVSQWFEVARCFHFRKPEDKKTYIVFLGFRNRPSGSAMIDAVVYGISERKVTARYNLSRATFEWMIKPKTAWITNFANQVYWLDHNG